MEDESPECSWHCDHLDVAQDRLRLQAPHSSIPWKYTLSGGPAKNPIIGGKENPYLLRWWIIPRNRWFNIYLHRFLRSDDDRALHDHPWCNVSILLDGAYYEHRPHGLRMRHPGQVLFRRPTARHRVELIREYRYSVEDRSHSRELPALTLFITGPRVREWGFWCEGKRFVHWEDFVAVDDPGGIGPGCGDGKG